MQKDYLNKYKYDNYTKEETYNLVKYHDMVTDADEVLIKKRLNRFGKERFLNLIKVQRADNLAQNPSYDRTNHLNVLEEMTERILQESCFSLSSLAINGSDLINAGFERGAKIGKILKALLEEVIENRLPNEKEDLLKRAYKLNENLL